jgi:crotonobetainyl-CoA:carnitine CoA-transferase CaiB-like acyl-CoA transferase
VQVEARGLVVEIEHPTRGTIRQVASTITTEGSNLALTPGPALGENTDQLLSDLLSLSETEIDELREQGAIG